MGTHVLISGASIAGPALAYWLSRGRFQVTVVEQSPRPRPGGQAVDIRGIARDVVHRMGLDTAVRAACTETTGATYVTRRNRPIVTLSADLFGGDGFIAEIEILRGDLSEVLRNATAGSTEYLFGDRIERLDEGPEGVRVRFAGGSERRFDLVIGADGLHSGLRALAFGPDVGRRLHLGQYLAFCTVPNHLGLDRRMVNYAEPGRAAAIRSIHHNRDAMALFSFRSGPLEHDHRDLDAQKSIVKRRLAGMAWEVPWLLDQIDAAPDFYFDSCTQVELPSWSRGRVALLGDAAFCPSPLSGQGTSLALVGAYLLAGELSTHPGDHAAGFAGYESRLRGFAEANQKIGRDNARMTNPATRFGLRLQYAMLLGMVHLPGSSLVMRRVMRALSDIELPDYPRLTTSTPA